MDIVTALIALIFVVSLMGLLAYGIQKLGLNGGQNMLAMQKNRQLKLLESMPLDPRRRLVLAQAGEKTYLIMTSANGEQIIDTDVKLRDIQDETDKQT